VTIESSFGYRNLMGIVIMRAKDVEGTSRTVRQMSVLLKLPTRVHGRCIFLSQSISIW
jgi:hypothetical protein